VANRGPNKRGVETRKKLLAAGMAEFHARGFSATGVDVIAKTAEVPKGSFYNFFESKTAFAAEVVDLYFERHQAKLRQCFEDKSQSALSRLRNYFEERIEFFRSIGCVRGCMMANLSIETADHVDVMRLRLADNFNSWSGVFADALREAQQTGESKSTADPEVLASFILNSWEGAILRMRVEQSVTPLEDAKAFIFGILMPD